MSGSASNCRNSDVGRLGRCEARRDLTLADIRSAGFLVVHLIADESDNHAVKVEEEHDEMEAELAERFLRDVSIACF